ncbi:hypothetical protein LJC25_04895 [Bacteroidales bacterium OttesenSCG-928-K03]|nr:hypothetical protein [Bacteroidales bacterium OttesenSCG-928-L14]MDL2243048.1 hypothetical protein [Bacteroidales bacterium OttesenSCG-928-K03]
MKIFKSITCVLVLLITITSCSKKTDEQIITDNVKGFAKALYTGDFKKAAKYCTDTAGESILSIESIMPEEMLTSIKKTKPTVEIIEVNIDELNISAKVKCVIQGAFDLNSTSGISPEGISTSFILHKDGNKWLIN